MFILFHFLKDHLNFSPIRFDVKYIFVYFRWRKLGGKDPPTLELIQKIQTLQKRLIARKEDIVDRETSIREKVM